MSMQNNPARGGAAVGLLADLPPLEAGVVRYLRRWFSGNNARAELHEAFCKSLGPDLAGSAFESFGQLCDYCVTHGRRPLIRHGVTCSCLGADENCFANLVAAATEGEISDADLFAALIVSPHQAQTLSALAAQTGLFLQQIAHAPASRRIYRPARSTVH